MPKSAVTAGSTGIPVHAINGVSRPKVPFDFAQGRPSPGCRRAQNDIG
ncbi:MAG: hypothetical protein WAO10_02030 [Candidatus Sulfotelmatobacter sp.]